MGELISISAILHPTPPTPHTHRRHTHIQPHKCLPQLHTQRSTQLHTHDTNIYPKLHTHNVYPNYTQTACNTKVYPMYTHATQMSTTGIHTHTHVHTHSLSFSLSLTHTHTHTHIKKKSLHHNCCRSRMLFWGCKTSNKAKPCCTQSKCSLHLPCLDRFSIASLCLILGIELGTCPQSKQHDGMAQV